MKIAIAVARVSTDEQARDGKTSLDTQLAEIDAWCPANGYDVVERVREEGVSVTGDLSPDTSPRPFWRAYDRLRAGKVDTIVFVGQDRLSRSDEPLKVALLLSEAASCGDGIRFVREPRATENPDIAGLVDYVRAISAKEDAGRRRQATTSGVLAKFRRGELALGPAPFGYRWSREAGAFEVVPAEAATVRAVFDLYAGQRWGMDRVADELTRRGVPTPATARRWRGAAGGRWLSTPVSRILRREYYATGEYKRPYQGEVFAFEIEPLVDRATFERARLLRASRPHVKRSRESNVRVNGRGVGRTGRRGLLQGLIRCGTCGERYWTGSQYVQGTWDADRDRGLSVPNYHCRRRRTQSRVLGAPGCPDSPVFEARELDMLVWGELRRQLATPAAFALVARAYVQRLEARIATFAPDLQRTQEHIDELLAERERTVESYNRLGGDLGNVEKRCREIDAEVERLKGLATEHAEDTVQLARLVAERDRVEALLKRGGGGLFVLGAPPRHLVALVDPAAPVDDGGQGADDEVHDRATGYLDGGGLRAETTQIVDELSIEVTVFPDRVEIEGVVQATLDLPTALQAACCRTPSAPRRR
jgi:DNA invertase Pin-like site-specific DNA recombinase